MYCKGLKCIYYIKIHFGLIQNVSFNMYFGQYNYISIENKKIVKNNEIANKLNVYMFSILFYFQYIVGNFSVFKKKRILDFFSFCMGMKMTFIAWTYFSSVIWGRASINLTNCGTAESVIVLFFRMRVDKVLLAATDSHNSSTQASVRVKISRLQKQDKTDISIIRWSLIMLLSVGRISLTPGAVVCSVCVSAPPTCVWLQNRPHYSVLQRDWWALTRQTSEYSPALETPPQSTHILSIYNKHTHCLDFTSGTVFMWLSHIESIRHQNVLMQLVSLCTIHHCILL